MSAASASPPPVTPPPPPQVDWVVQFTAPVCVSGYVHGGCTARGSSVIFLLPSEAGFVKNLEAARILLAEMTLRQVIILIMVLILHYYSGAAETAVVQRDLQHWAHPQIHGEGGLRPAAADEEEIKASSWLQDLACQALVLEA